MSNNNIIGWKPQNYESRVASVRIRCLNVIQALQAQGVPIELFKPKNEKNYSTVIFSKTYNERDIETAKRLKQQGTRILFDICDNHFLLSTDRVARLKRMLKLADCWIVSSQEMANTINRHLEEKKPLWIIEDAVEENLHGNRCNIIGLIKARYLLIRLSAFLKHPENRTSTHLVWFGNHKASYHNSGLMHVSKLQPLLEKLHHLSPITLTVISNSNEVFKNIFTNWAIPVAYLEWNAHSFLSALKMHDIAVIPIEVNEFTKVKTNNRILLSLNLGLGVVADRIQSYDIFSECSFLDRWEEGLTAYIHNPGLIKAHTQAAAKLIQENYSMEVIAGKWKKLLTST